MIDLTKFCGNDKFKHYINAPISLGGHTYATDGRIVVRVARRDDVPEQQTLITEASFNNALALSREPHSFQRFPMFRVPSASAKRCIECAGRGTEHDCPDCECECSYCDGTGLRDAKRSASINGVPYDVRYLTLLLALPNVEIDGVPPASQPLRFRFDGGIGVLMPLTHESETHLGDIFSLPVTTE